MADQEQTANQLVIVTLVKAFTRATKKDYSDIVNNLVDDSQYRFVDESSFLNGVAQMIRAEDRDALQRRYFSIGHSDFQSTSLKGDAARIIEALEKAFNGRAGRENILLSEAKHLTHDAQTTAEVSSDNPSNVRQFFLTVTKPLLDVVTEGNLPVDIRGPGYEEVGGVRYRQDGPPPPPVKF